MNVYLNDGGHAVFRCKCGVEVRLGPPSHRVHRGAYGTFVEPEFTCNNCNRSGVVVRSKVRYFNPLDIPERANPRRSRARPRRAVVVQDPGPLEEPPSKEVIDLYGRRKKDA